MARAVAGELRRRGQVHRHHGPPVSNIAVATLQQHRRRAAHPGHLRRRRAAGTLVHSKGVRADRGLNVIPVGDREFLLTVTAGDAVHLSREAGPDETGRGAVPGWHPSPGRVNSRVRWRACNRAPLAEPRWAATTLCGRQWIAMADDEAGGGHEPSDQAAAPTCHRCLAIMDKLFPEPVPDGRLLWNRWNDSAVAETLSPDFTFRRSLGPETSAGQAGGSTATWRALDPLTSATRLPSWCDRESGRRSGFATARRIPDCSWGCLPRSGVSTTRVRPSSPQIIDGSPAPGSSAIPTDYVLSSADNRAGRAL